jgi:hypothetical protein
MPKSRPSTKPDRRRSKSVVLQPAHCDTLNKAVDFLIEQLTPESASGSITGFAKSLAILHLRNLQRTVGE